MLGFSIQKLLVLAAVVAAVWYGFKFIGRLDQKRKAEAKSRAASGGAGAGSANTAQRRAEPETQAEDMVLCDACNAYVPARGKTNCGRADCPY